MGQLIHYQTFTAMNKMFYSFAIFAKALALMLALLAGHGLKGQQFIETPPPRRPLHC
jgi:hypothetical protein